jgi:hypothetical protein
MNTETPFSQSTALKPGPRGICLRVSYKWASCKFRGQPFKFYGLNWTKTYAKQLDYLQEPDAVRAETSGMETGYFAWVLAAHRNDGYFIDHWGKKHGDIKCRAHRVQDVSEFLGGGGQDEFFVYCYYGRTGTGAAWGHAVAFSGRSAEGPRFFDSNRAEYSFASSEDVGQAIDTHCNGYATGGNVILDRYIYELYR